MELLIIQIHKGFIILSPNKACSRQVGFAAFFKLFLALGFSRFDAESQPAHLWLTLAVRR